MGAEAEWQKTRDHAALWPRKKPGRQLLSAGGWQCQTGGSGGGGGGARRGPPGRAGWGFRPVAGGHCRVVEKCEGLSLGGLAAVSRKEGTGRDQTEMS